MKPIKAHPYERGPVPRTRTLRPGEMWRKLNRRAGEDGADATSRARDFPWWADVLEEAPYWTGSYWMWAARATKEAA
jgi:hypothetical protein